MVFIIILVGFLSVMSMVPIMLCIFSSQMSRAEEMSEVEYYDRAEPVVFRERARSRV